MGDQKTNYTFNFFEDIEKIKRNNISLYGQSKVTDIINSQEILSYIKTYLFYGILSFFLFFIFFIILFKIIEGKDLIYFYEETFSSWIYIFNILKNIPFSSFFFSIILFSILILFLVLINLYFTSKEKIKIDNKILDNFEKTLITSLSERAIKWNIKMLETMIGETEEIEKRRKEIIKKAYLNLKLNF